MFTEQSVPEVHTDPNSSHLTPPWYHRAEPSSSSVHNHVTSMMGHIDVLYHAVFQLNEAVILLQSDVNRLLYSSEDKDLKIAKSLLRQLLQFKDSSHLYSLFEIHPYFPHNISSLDPEIEARIRFAIPSILPVWMDHGYRPSLHQALFKRISDLRSECYSEFIDSLKFSQLSPDLQLESHLSSLCLVLPSPVLTLTRKRQRDDIDPPQPIATPLARSFLMLMHYECTFTDGFDLKNQSQPIFCFLWLRHSLELAGLASRPHGNYHNWQSCLAIYRSFIEVYRSSINPSYDGPRMKVSS